MCKSISCLICCGTLGFVGLFATSEWIQDDGSLIVTNAPTAVVSLAAMSEVPTIEEPAINDVCPIRGEAVNADSPTVEYHGFTIGVCTERHGEVFLKNMTDRKRDAFVAKHVEFVESGCAVTGCACPSFKQELMVTHKGVLAPLCCAACFKSWHISNEQQRDAWFTKFVYPVRDAAESGVPVPVLREPIEFSRNANDNSLAIGYIDPGGIFAGSGLAVGDTLLAINDAPVSKVTPDDFESFMTDAFYLPELPVFSVNRDGKVLDIPVSVGCATGATACGSCSDPTCAGACTPGFDADSFDGMVLQITGMTCEACVETVGKAISSVDGVDHAEVSLEDNVALVRFNDYRRAETDPNLYKAIEDAGFTAEITDNAWRTGAKAIRLEYTTGAQFAGCGTADGIVLSIHDLEPDSPGARAGLEVGDIIVSINGVVPFEIPSDQLADRMKDLLNTPKPLVFKVDRIDEIVEITVTPEPISRKSEKPKNAS